MWVSPCGSVSVRRLYRYVDGVRWIVVCVGRGGGFLYHHTRDMGGSPVDYCPYKEPFFGQHRVNFGIPYIDQVLYRALLNKF